MEPERGVVHCHAGAEGYKSPSAMSVVGKKKLQKELRDLNASPPAHIAAVTVAEKNLYDFYALCQGPDDTPYEGGWYIAKLRFPPEYPNKPPAVLMLTPSGRFTPNTRLCLSMSDFHPESWSPLWSVASILTGLLSFMVGSEPTTGSVITTDEEKRALAAASVEYNLTTPGLKELFPQLRQLADSAAAERQLRRSCMQQQRAAAADAAARRAEVFLLPAACDGDEGCEDTAIGAVLRDARRAIDDAMPDVAVDSLVRALEAHTGDAGRVLALLPVLVLSRIALGDFDAAMAGIQSRMQSHIQGSAWQAKAEKLLTECSVATAAKRDGNTAFAAKQFDLAAQLYSAGADALLQATGVHTAVFPANLAAVSASKGDTAGVIAHARAALAVHKGHVKACRRLADALASHGNVSQCAEAVELYDALLLQFPTDAGLRAAVDAARSKLASNP